MGADAFALKSVFNRHGNFGRFVITGDVGACGNNGVILTGRPRDDQSELPSRIGRVAERPHEFRRRLGEGKESMLPGFG